MLIFRIALMEGDYTFFRMARKVRIHAKGRLNQGFFGIGQRGNIAVEPSEEAFQRCTRCLGRLANSGHGVRFFFLIKIY